MRTRNSTRSTPLNRVSNPHIMLGDNGAQQLQPIKQLQQQKPYEPEVGFYSAFEDLYEEFVSSSDFFKSRITEGRQHHFHMRTKAFVIVVNFLRNKNLISDYAAWEIKVALLADPFYQGYEDVIKNEGKLFLTKSYFHQLTEYGTSKINLLERVFSFLLTKKDALLKSKENIGSSFYEAFVSYENLSDFLIGFQSIVVQDDGPFVNVDHIVARSKNGLNTLRNAAVISKGLNGKKSDHTPGPILRKSVYTKPMETRTLWPSSSSSSS